MPDLLDKLLEAEDSEEEDRILALIAEGAEDSDEEDSDDFEEEEEEEDSDEEEEEDDDFEEEEEEDSDEDETIQDTPQQTTPQQTQLETWLSCPEPEIRYILDPIISSPGSAEIYGPTGAGKTWLATSLAVAVASGQDWLCWPCSRPHRVAYVAGPDMSYARMRERIRTQIEIMDPDIKILHDNLVVYDAQHDPRYTCLGDPECRSELSMALYGTELIVFDNVLSLFLGPDHSSQQSWSAIQGWLSEMVHRGTSYLLVHHTGKSGAVFGTVTREVPLDTVISWTARQTEDGFSGYLSLDKQRDLMERSKVRVEFDGSSWDWERTRPMAKPVIRSDRTSRSGSQDLQAQIRELRAEHPAIGQRDLAYKLGSSLRDISAAIKAMED